MTSTPLSPAQQTVLDLRQQLYSSEYRPVAVRTGDKRPFGGEWQNRARRDPPEAVSEVPKLEHSIQAF